MIVEPRLDVRRVEVQNSSMQLSTYIQRTRALGDLKVPATAVEAVEAKIASGEANFDQVLSMRSD